MKTYTAQTYIGEDDCTVTVAYYPGRPGVHTLRNGDPGYPDEPAELELLSVMVRGRDVLSELTDEQADQLSERCEELVCEQIYADESAYWNDYAKSIKEEA